METTKLPVAKKFSNILRVIFYMLRNSMSKGKLSVDLNNFMKRGKIVGKAIQNLISYQHRKTITSSIPHEYEFSCSNTPTAFPFHISKKCYSHFFTCAQAPKTDDDDFVTASAVKMALEMFHSVGTSPSALESPWLPVLSRKTPLVRVTDSPFPIGGSIFEDDKCVDAAAEDFIKKFYKDLKKQNVLAIQY